MAISKEQARKLLERGLISQDTYDKVPEPNMSVDPTLVPAPAPVAEEPVVPEPVLSPSEALNRAGRAATTGIQKPIVSDEDASISELKNRAGRAATTGVQTSPEPITDATDPTTEPASKVSLDELAIEDNQPAESTRRSRMGEAANTMLSAYDIRQEAMAQAAEAGAMRAEEEAAFLDAFNREMEERRVRDEQEALQKQEYIQKQLNSLDQKLEEIGKQSINPNAYWENKSTGSKILTGLGLFLGAFGGGGNQAATIVQNAIQRDIDTQIANLNNKKSTVKDQMGLVQQMAKSYDDVRSIRAASMAAAYSNAQSKLQSIAAKYSAPAIRAKAQEGMAILEQEKQKWIMEFEQAQSARIDEGADVRNLTVDQIKDKEQRERFVPGMGFAATKEDATKLKAEGADVYDSIDVLDKLEALFDQTGKSINPKSRQEAEQLLNIMAGKMRVALTGGGPLTPEERDMLKSVVGNPTKFFTLDSIERSKLATLKSLLQRSRHNKAKSYGIKIHEPQLNTLKRN